MKTPVFGLVLLAFLSSVFTPLTVLYGSPSPAGNPGAEPLIEGRVRLTSGAPVAGAQVRVFDLADLRAAPIGATTDQSGHFTLSLGALPGTALPEGFELGSNYPNPFNPSTLIPYRLPSSMHVRLEVFNLLGQRIATLVDGERPAGFHTAEWDATDAAGQAVGAGVYLYRLSGEAGKITRRMLLVDGPAGSASASSAVAARDEAGPAGETALAYGLTVSGPELVPYVDPAFRVTAGMSPLDVVVETPSSAPRAKVASGGILGDVDNTGRVDFLDALLVALYSRDSSIVMPNSGDISLGDVNADGRVDLSDVWVIAAYLNDPTDPTLPAGIGRSPDPAPDLVVRLPSLPVGARVMAGQSFALSAVVDNQGSAPSARTTLRFYQSTDTTITTVDTEIGTDSVSPLGAPGGTIPNIRPTAPSTAGTYYYGACVDAVSGESDTTNNCSTALTVMIGPDLVVDTPTVSNSGPTAGASFTLSTAAPNRGNMPSASTTLRFVRSSDSTITASDTVVGTAQVSRAIPFHGVTVQSVTLTAPSDPGTYYYGACVDSVTGEFDTQNNCSAAVTVTVGGAPDLVVDNPTVSESAPVFGARFTLSATVRNQGSASSGSTTLRYYLSSDSTISSSDTPAGSDPVGGLAASGSSAQSVSLTTL
ncbi:MAG: T9SS type A sorting domain-containing protein, partial [Acidobacteria bacterium]|nr:T9SS type A sorting domain-containing protein [Acidobacteriota bacterium]